MRSRVKAIYHSGVRRKANRRCGKYPVAWVAFLIRWRSTISTRARDGHAYHGKPQIVDRVRRLCFHNLPHCPGVTAKHEPISGGLFRSWIRAVWLIGWSTDEQHNSGARAPPVGGLLPSPFLLLHPWTRGGSGVPVRRSARERMTGFPGVTVVALSPLLLFLSSFLLHLKADRPSHG